jgi:hypothetical protein
MAFFSLLSPNLTHQSVLQSEYYPLHFLLKAKSNENLDHENKFFKNMFYFERIFSATVLCYVKMLFWSMTDHIYHGGLLLLS